MDDVARLIAIEAIRSLKARYFRLVDTKDWPGFRALLDERIEFDLSDSGYGVVIGAEAVMARVRDSLDGCVSIHHGYAPEIEIVAGDRATGVWPMEDVLLWRGDAARPETTLHGYGHYHETYERSGGVWRIRTLRLKRLRVNRSSRTISAA